MSWKALVPLLLALSPLAHGDIFSITPAQPRFQESVRLHVDQQSEIYIGPGQISMSGNAITVPLRDSGFILPPGGSPFDIPLGQFPAGDYDVKVTQQGSGFTLATLHFHVGDMPVSNDVPLGDYSDLWWNPSESGWGMTIVEHPSSNLFAAWFVYGADGKPTWYVLPGGAWKDGTFSGDLYKTTGPYFGGEFNPANVQAARAGTASLKFYGLDNGMLSYTADGVTASKAIEREGF